MKRIYLDYAASTPVDPEVFRAMELYIKEKFGNPGSLHFFGQEAIAALDASRESIARTIGAEFREIIFTSSATEANNLGVRGAIAVAGAKRNIERPRIIVSAIEHESILETARSLEREGVEVIYLPVDKNGIVDLELLQVSLNDSTILVSIMYANNEIGVVQPIAEIAKIIRAAAAGDKAARRHILFHADATQAFQFLNCNVKNLDVDLMTFSSHKIYGPKGAGALYVKNKSNINAIISGGGQEYNLRSGTENVPAIVGFAKAVELADSLRNKEAKRISVLRSAFWDSIRKIYPAAEINGSKIRQTSAENALTLPNILNVYFPGAAAQDLLTQFDLAGVAVASGSACRSRAMESSYVIEALGYSKERAKSSIRFSLGKPTTRKDIDAVMKLFPRKIRKV